MIAGNIPFITVYKGNYIARTTCTVDMLPGIVSDVVPVMSPLADDILYRYVELPAGKFYVEPINRPGCFEVKGYVPPEAQV